MAKKETLPTDHDGSSTQIGLHSVKNLLGSEEQLTLFSERRSALTELGLPRNSDLKKFGFDLNDFEQRILEAILYGFTQSKYQGNTDPVNLEAISKNKSLSKENVSPYKNITQIPCLKTSQRKIMNWAGLKTNSVANFQRTEEALKKIGSTSYCFYYSRLAFDDQGNPIKKKDGSWKKEEVMAIDNLFTIKAIRNENSGKVDYYELVPSPIFLDQRENYFMLIPYDWREEVQKFVGRRKTSSYTLRFLLFLMYQFELKRRSPKESKPYKIAWSPKEIAKAIKISETEMKRKKGKVDALLTSAYEVAKQLGYLSDFERTSTVDILWLNEDKYISSHKSPPVQALPKQAPVQSPQKLLAASIYQFLVDEKRKIDPKYNPTFGGPTYQASLKHLEALLQNRSVNDIKDVISWGIAKPYWTSHIGTASKLKKNFQQAFTEMKLDKSKTNPAAHNEENKAFVLSTLKNLKSKNSKKTRVEVLNQYVEIGSESTHPTIIAYSEKGFKEQFLNALKKWGFKDVAMENALAEVD